MLLDVFTALPLLFVALCAALGLAVGSFLNVVIYRLPIILNRQWRRESRLILQPEDPEAEQEDELSLAYPESHCPECRRSIKPWQNIPLVSYLLLKGRCAYCKTEISVRYPCVEALTGVTSAVVAWTLGEPELVFAALLFTWCLIALAMIDADQYLLPDQITLPLLWCGLLLNCFATFAPLADAVFGATAGYLSLWLVYWIFKVFTGKKGMGHGDFKLLAASGAWMGWQVLPLIILLSSLIGALAALVMLLAKKRERDAAIPFGPYLALSGWIGLLWGQQLIQAYFQFVGIR